MREFYLSHPSCEQFFPRWLRLEEDIQNRSEEEASGFRLDGVSSDLSKVFNVRKIVPRPLELMRLGEWAIGSTHAEICIRVHSMRLSQDRRAIFGVLGIRATFDERCALACLEQLMQRYLLMHIYTLRKEPEFAVASAVESLRLAAKCTEVGQISRRNAYAEFLSRSAHNKNFARRFDYWAPTQMLRKIAHFVSDHPHLREHPQARKFQGKVLEYNVAKSGISEQFVV
jgi:hypothetical protein